MCPSDNTVYSDQCMQTEAIPFLANLGPLACSCFRVSAVMATPSGTIQGGCGPTPTLLCHTLSSVPWLYLSEQTTTASYFLSVSGA